MTYYGTWDTGELYDLESDPDELQNLIASPDHQQVAMQMENELYGLRQVGGLQIPLNQPRSRSNNLRLRNRSAPGDFRERFIVDQPVNRGAR